MKLVAKLLAAPVLNAVVVFSVGPFNALVTGRAAQANETALPTQVSELRSLQDAQQQLTHVNTGVYATLAMAGNTNAS